MDFGMDMWKYYHITHKDHTIMNPMSLSKMKELIELLRLPDGGRILDMACGKAEFLCLIVERYGVTATGIELSPYTIEAARKNVEDRKLSSRIELLHMDGSKFNLDRTESLDLASCIGASWIYQNHAGTLKALKGMVRPGGLILVGEPFWRNEPDPEYLKLMGYNREICGSHAENVKTGEDIDLSFLYSLVSNQDDWDRYEGLQWQAAQRYSAAHPNDPDVGAIMRVSGSYRDSYLCWGRDCLGWALYLFRKS
jgi:SAM-dependent methyltransferase